MAFAEVDWVAHDDDQRLQGQGGVIVQRGIHHLWRHTGDHVCRIAFILIEVPAYRHDGAPLAEAKTEQVHPAFRDAGPH